eukprot:7204631-Lingulodinium_polyedra.AAC.1
MAHASHARALHAQTSSWPAHGTRESAVCEPPLRRNVATVAWRLRCRNGSRTTRSRTPRTIQWQICAR